MNLAIKHANILPARTWIKLGLNDAKVSGEIPEAAPYAGDRPLGDLPAGVTLFSGPSPAAELETGMGRETENFINKNKNCGFGIRVAAGVHADKPVFFTYRIGKTSPYVVDETTVIAEKGSEVTVVVSYLGDGEDPCFHAGATRIYAEKDAAVHLVMVQMLGDRCLSLDDIGASAQENGFVDVTQAELGGKQAYAGCRAGLEGRKSRFELNEIYFGDKDRSLDINDVAQHLGEKTRSEIHVSGALLDRSEKTFRGTIDFIKGSKQAVGRESEFNLLFSPAVRNRTAPLILCSEEDVDGQHAATTGKIDEDKLFYLMTRGLSELDAKKLIIEAQFRPVTDRIPDGGLRNSVLEYVKERLNRIEPLS